VGPTFEQRILVLEDYFTVWGHLAGRAHNADTRSLK